MLIQRNVQHLPFLLAVPSLCMQDFLQTRTLNEAPRWWQLPSKILNSGKFTSETFLAIFKCTAPPVEVKANSNTDKLLCQLRRHKHYAALLSIAVLRLRVCSSEMGRIRPEGVHSCLLWICGCLFIPDKDNSHRHQWESLPVHHSKLLFFFFTHFTAFPDPIYLKH